MFTQEDVLADLDDNHDFGSLLKVLRTSQRVKQAEIIALLPGWTPSMYVRLENGQTAPAFDQLLPVYRAFQLAGISFPLSARHQFVHRARSRMEGKRTHRDQHSDAEWAELRYQLTRMSTPPDSAPAPAHLVTQPLLAETAHLLGREAWREQLLEVLTCTPRAKLVIISGPAGVGKSSELNWLASYLLHERPFFSRLILCDFRAIECMHGAQEAFEMCVGSLLADLGLAPCSPQTPAPTLDEQASRLLLHLEQAAQPVIILLDHCECLLEEHDVLAPCWQRFFTRLLRSHHRATFVLATNRWAGWYHGEQRFVAHHELPPLSAEKGVLLLQQSGLDSVPVWLLERLCEKVGGLPLCLEWVTALVKEPLVLDEWGEFGEGESQVVAYGESIPHRQTQAVQRLLAEPHIFGGSLADAVAPLLERVIASQRLSVEAQTLLHVLAVATLPLAKPALKMFCPQGPRPIKELRNACLLVAYPKRTQLLPLIASAVYRQFSPEQRQEQETLLIQAYRAWVEEGTFQEGDSEQGAVITELAVLLLRNHRLLEAAEHVIRYGWISFNLGYGPRLARLAKDVMGRFDWRSTRENECAVLLMQQMLFGFLGENVDATWQEHSQRLRDALLADEMRLPSAAEHRLIHLLVMYATNDLCFEEAQILLNAYRAHLEARQVPHLEEHTPLLKERAELYSRWSEYAEEQGDMQQAKSLREQAIALYKQYSALLEKEKMQSPLKNSLHKRSLAYCFNNLSYELSRNGQHEEALQFVECSIALKEQGHTHFAALAASYGEKAEILMELGRFQEALRFGEKAFAEIQRCADTGYALAHHEVWMYRVIRGRLYLRLGRVDEAGQLLREALPHIRPERRMYRMFADKALEEIKQWRQHAPSAQHQLDWRWVERYRELNAYDGHGWLAHAGPFTQEEQQQWDALFPARAQEAAKGQLGTLITHSRERELAAAVAEQREPRLHYPAIEIEEVRRRLAALLQLDTEIGQEEPNALVRHLYHGMLEEEVDFLRMIEATYEGNTENYWACNLHLDQMPTPEEVEYALCHIKRAVLQGLQRPETAEVSQRLHEFLQTRLHLSLDLPSGCQESEERPQETASSSAQSERTISTQAAKHFFEAVLAESGYDDWRVVIDTAATNPRVEIGMRVFFLCNRSFSLEEIRHWLAHEIAGHAARAVAGERSLLGLLGIDTKRNLATEEGLTLYHERQVATLHGQAFHEDGIWLGSLTTGLASGVLTPAQTFLSLYCFLELYCLLRQLLERPKGDMQKAQQHARKIALSMCLRAYRGVPDLERAGVCYLKDSVYLRGLRMIERAVAEDKTVLDRLAVGRVALEHLPQMQELGIVSAPQPLLQRAYDPDLDAHILTFEEQSEESSHQQA